MQNNSGFSLARFPGYRLGVDFLSESIQTDSFFRNVLLDQEQQRHLHQRSFDGAQQVLHLLCTLVAWREVRFNHVTPLVLGWLLEILALSVFGRILEEDLVERIIIFPRYDTVVWDRVKYFAECVGVGLGTIIPQVEKFVRHWIHHGLVLAGTVVIDVRDTDWFEILVWLFHVLRHK